MGTPTPGEWHAHGPTRPTEAAWTICTHPTNTVLAVVIRDRNLYPGEAEANARLMAAAPNLLEACRGTELFLRALARRDEAARRALTVLTSAIAKADGRES